MAVSQRKVVIHHRATPRLPGAEQLAALHHSHHPHTTARTNARTPTTFYLRALLALDPYTYILLPAALIITPPLDTFLFILDFLLLPSLVTLNLS